MINPDNEGESTSANIRTYTDSFKATLVDEDITQSKTIIQVQTAASAHTIVTASVITNTLIPQIEFTITPIVSVVSGGHIDIYVPSEFKLGDVVTANCMILPNGGAWQGVTSCYNIDNRIRMELSAAFPLNLLSRFRLDNVVTSPAYEGIYLFDITTYGQGDGTTVSESYSDYYQINPSPFPSIAVTNYVRDQSRPTIIQFSFTTNYIIPAGKTPEIAQDTKGYLEFSFTHTNAYFGTGYTSTTRIPCRAVAGLTASNNFKNIIY